MSHDASNPDPTPEELAAHADGELDPARGAAVEAWLARHPEAAGDVEAWRRLDRLFAEAAPPEPAPAAWDAARDRVAAELRRRPGWAWRAAAGAAAAAVLLALLTRLLGPAPVRPPAAEPYPVADAADVVILSIDPADAGALVVGTPPAVGPIELAAADDVVLLAAEPHPESGAWADMWQGDGAAPMIVPAGPGDR